MLDKQTMKVIREAQEMMREMRMDTVTLVRIKKSDTKDPFTGEYETTHHETLAEAVWSNITSGGPGSDDITMVAGILAESGDAIAKFAIEYDLDDVTHVIHKGEEWVIRAKDPIGLGEVNRHYVLLRRVT